MVSIVRGVENVAVAVVVVGGRGSVDIDGGTVMMFEDGHEGVCEP